MVKRKKQKRVVKKVVVKRVKKRVVKKRKKVTAMSPNAEAYWAAYRDLQQRANQAVAQLQASIQRNAPPEVLARNQNDVLLVLGECDYMTRECRRMASSQKPGQKTSWQRK